MKLVGLYGPSGSGKSHVADRIAREIGAGWVIDDGLLIRHGRIVAGHSAKFEKTRMQAVKRAIFDEMGHRAEVRRALDEISPDSTLLILGTSQKMIRRICASLDLGEEVQWMHVNSVVDEDAMAFAQNLRNSGLHAIPILEAKVEQTRIRQVLSKIRWNQNESDVSSLENESQRSYHNPYGGARTIVNPLFTEGMIYVHPRAIRQSILELVNHEGHPFVVDKLTVNIEDMPCVSLRLKVLWGVHIERAATKLESDVRAYLRSFLGLSVVRVDLSVTTVLLPKGTVPSVEQALRALPVDERTP